MAARVSSVPAIFDWPCDALVDRAVPERTENGDESHRSSTF
jgi:hypothetical protein